MNKVIYKLYLDEEGIFIDMSVGSVMAWIIPMIIILFWGLGFYALILLIKALKIYIDKNS